MNLIDNKHPGLVAIVALAFSLIAIDVGFPLVWGEFWRLWVSAQLVTNSTEVVESEAVSDGYTYDGYGSQGLPRNQYVSYHFTIPSGQLIKVADYQIADSRLHDESSFTVDYLRSNVQYNLPSFDIERNNRWFDLAFKFLLILLGVFFPVAILYFNARNYLRRILR